jgi:Kef-type K+ transport system membrane component KefB
MHPPTSVLEAVAVDPQAFPELRTFAAFAVAAVAASTISEWTRKTLRLPLITGYILGGILCGPFVIGILSRPQCLQLSHVVTEDAMGFIGFSAGSKFLLSELAGSLRPVLSLLLGLVSVTYLLVLGGLGLASPWLQLTAGSPPSEVLSIILIIACLAVARSPSSAIALVSELSAHGTFTTAALSVTVLMDVVVVLLFALTLLIVHAIAPSDATLPPPSVATVLGLFGLQMLLSALVGVGLGYVLHAFISCTSYGVSAATRGHKQQQQQQQQQQPGEPGEPGESGEPGEPSQPSEPPADEPHQPPTKPLPSPPPSPPGAPAKAGDASFAVAAKPSGMPAARARPQLRRFNSVIGASQHGGSASAAAAAALVAAKKEASGALFATSEAAHHRRAALLALLWLGAKLGLIIVESLVMQLTGFEVRTCARDALAAAAARDPLARTQNCLASGVRVAHSQARADSHAALPISHSLPPPSPSLALSWQVFDTESLEERSFGVSFHQPLVITMVAGFIITNFTSSRRSFLRILHDSSEPVYIAFFTLTGMTLQLDALLPNLPTAALIFGLRFAGVSIGSYWGGRLVGS